MGLRCNIITVKVLDHHQLLDHHHHRKLRVSRRKGCQKHWNITSCWILLGSQIKLSSCSLEIGAFGTICTPLKLDFRFRDFRFCLYFHVDLECLLTIFSSVRSSSGYHGLIEIRSAAAAATFSDFSNSSDSKVKVKVKGPNMCYIFEKHWIQGY